MDQPSISITSSSKAPRLPLGQPVLSKAQGTNDQPHETSFSSFLGQPAGLPRTIDIEDNILPPPPDSPDATMLASAHPRTPERGTGRASSKSQVLDPDDFHSPIGPSPSMRVKMGLSPLPTLTELISPPRKSQKRKPGDTPKKQKKKTRGDFPSQSTLTNEPFDAAGEQKRLTSESGASYKSALSRQASTVPKPSIPLKQTSSHPFSDDHGLYNSQWDMDKYSELIEGFLESDVF